MEIRPEGQDGVVFDEQQRVGPFAGDHSFEKLPLVLNTRLVGHVFKVDDFHIKRILVLNGQSFDLEEVKSNSPGSFDSYRPSARGGKILHIPPSNRLPNLVRQLEERERRNPALLFFVVIQHLVGEEHEVLR